MNCNRFTHGSTGLLSQKVPTGSPCPIASQIAGIPEPGLLFRLIGFYSADGEIGNQRRRPLAALQRKLQSIHLQFNIPRHHCQDFFLHGLNHLGGEVSPIVGDNQFQTAFDFLTTGV